MSPDHGKASHPSNAARPTRGPIRPPNQADERPDTFRGQPDIHHHEPPKPGLAVCEQCHAIWKDQHWGLDEQEAQRLLAEGVETTVCLGCMKVARKEYDGQVRLNGAFVRAHQDELMGLIKNTEKHIREHNPIARIANITMFEDGLEVLTISPFLAERIGKECRKAYDGTLEVSRPERQEFISVQWRRD